MKKWLAILLLVGLAGCSPQGVVTAWHWKAFLRSPDEATFKPLYADVKACQSAGCPQGEQVDEEMIDDLADLVRAKDPNALKLALAADRIVAHNATGAEYLNASYGPAICDKPLLFLQDADAAQRHDAVMVIVTPEGLIDNSNGQYNELGRGRAALMTVSDPGLMPLRDRFVTALDQARKNLEPGLIPRVPPPMPQASLNPAVPP